MVVRPLLSILCFATSVAALAAGSGGPGGPSPDRWRPIVKGTLPSGLRYAILPRTSRDPGVSILLRDEGGFLAERRPGERGLAHLIEHVALLSPTVGAPDDLRHLVHVAGPVTLPAPSAGTTSWRETNYFLSTRTTDAASIDTVLGAMREIATDLTFRADAVDEGRQQVIAEMQRRRPGNEEYARYIAAVAPGSPNDVIDAQNSYDVGTASVATIRQLYARLYRPANLMVVVVGDVDPARVRSMIERHFGQWRNPAERPPPRVIPRFRQDRIAPISVAAQPGGRRVAMMTVASPVPPPAPRHAEIVSLLTDRLAIAVAAARLSPAGGGVAIERGEQGHRLVMLWAIPENDAWQPAVVRVATLGCAFAGDGFSVSEWDAAKGTLLQSLERETAAMGEQPNVEVAKDVSHALADRRDPITPDALLRAARSFLPPLTAAAGNRWWRQQWRLADVHLRVETPSLDATADPMAVIRAVADRAAPSPSCRVRR